MHGVLLRPLPYPEPDRIVRVFEVDSSGTRSTNMSDPNFADLREQSRSFEAFAKFNFSVMSVSAGGEAARVMVASVSRDFFRVMGVQPRYGRTFHADELREGAAPVAIVSHGYWQRYLAGDPELSKHTLTLDDFVIPIVGVMPPGFTSPEGADIWTPREPLGETPSRTALNSKVIGRLAGGVPIERARAEVSGIARRLKAEYGRDIWMVDAAVIPLHEEIVGRTRLALLLLLGASGLLLLIACANVVNLLLARATVRQHELAVRIALGAGRGRVVRQFLTESLLLAVLGGALGLLLARWGVNALRTLPAGDLPRLAEIQVDGAVLVFALAVSVLVAVGLGLLAAWRATGREVRASLAAGGRTRAGATSTRLRGALVVSQVALTLMLLVGTGLLLRSFQRLLTTEPGYRTVRAVAVNAYLPYPETDEQAARQGRFYRRLIDRLSALPGVTEIGGIDALPLHSQGANGGFLLLNRPDEVTSIEDWDRVSQDEARTGYAEYRRATPGYFRAMQIPLLRGRLFDERDRQESVNVAVVSESFAEETWPDEDPIGKLIQYANMEAWNFRPFTVIGVVGDIREASLEAEPRPTFYANSYQRPGALAAALNIVLVTPGDPTALMAAARRTVHDLDPQVAPSIQTLKEIYAASLAERRFQLLLLGVFGTTALLLALVGIYGVISFHVTQRTREIGVRMALGATGETVVRLVVRQGLLLAGLGVGIGLAGALAVTRLMRSLLYGVTATDPVTFLAVPFLLVIAVVLACFLPARRAASVDPMIALRSD